MTSHELLDELLKAEFRQLRIRNLAAEEEADGYSCCYRGRVSARIGIFTGRKGDLDPQPGGRRKTHASWRLFASSRGCSP